MWGGGAGRTPGVDRLIPGTIFLLNLLLPKLKLARLPGKVRRSKGREEKRSLTQGNLKGIRKKKEKKEWGENGTVLNSGLFYYSG